MFNSRLKKDALKIHEEVSQRYKASHEKMQKSCEQLYEVRKTSVDLIKMMQEVINSIANSPKEFETVLGKVEKEMIRFKETEEYAEEAYHASVKAGVGVAAGAAAGIGIAAMAPTALMAYATAYGVAATGTAIRTLAGAAAQKAALAYIGRTFAGFAVKQGAAGMAAGKAFLALAGPVGWGITGASMGISFISLSNKNKKVADEAVKEAKDIAIAREALDEAKEDITAIKIKTELLYADMHKQSNDIMRFKNSDYKQLSEQEQYFLGTVVNNTLSLSTLLNETVK